MSRVISHILSAIISAWLAVSITFIGIRMLPGDAITAQFQQGELTQTQIEFQRELLELDLPIYKQYISFWSGVITGNFGESLTYGIPVSDLIGQRIKLTVELGLLSLIVAVVLGLSIGLLATDIHQYKTATTTARILIGISLGTPIIITGTIVTLTLSSAFGFLPATGYGTIQHLILPASLLGFHSAGAIARSTQTQVQKTHQAIFIVAARGKGISETRIMTRHLAKLIMPPVSRVIALQGGFLLSGTAIIEELFVRPGLGNLLVISTMRQDYPVLQALVLIAAFTYAAFVIMAEVSHALLDPRIVN